MSNHTIPNPGNLHPHRRTPASSPRPPSSYLNRSGPDIQLYRPLTGKTAERIIDFTGALSQWLRPIPHRVKMQQPTVNILRLDHRQWRSSAAFAEQTPAAIGTTLLKGLMDTAPEGYTTVTEVGLKLGGGYTRVDLRLTELHDTTTFEDIQSERRQALDLLKKLSPSDSQHYPPQPQSTHINIGLLKVLDKDQLPRSSELLTAMHEILQSAGLTLPVQLELGEIACQLDQ